MPTLFEQRLARGWQGEPMEGPELTAMFAWLIILGVIFLVLSPIVSIVSIFWPAVGDKVLLPLFQIGGGIFCAPFLWYLLPILWSCLVYILENLGDILEFLLDGLKYVLLGLVSLLGGMLIGVFDFLRYVLRETLEGLESLPQLALDFTSTCWDLLKIIIYRTPPFSYFWRHWTIQPHRFGWQSPRQSNSQPHSDDNSKSDYRTSSSLCTECLRVVGRSGLLVGSISFFTPRVEWHNWLVSLHGLDLDSSQEFCHLCNIFWHSIPETRRRVIVTRNDLGISDTGQVQIDQTIQLRVKIWEDYEGLWYDEHRRYMQVYLGEVVQCDSFEIREGRSFH